MSLPTTRLGRTDLQVSRLCLGTMQFGWTADRRASFAILDAFVEAGGNFVDTADIYSRTAEAGPGISETLIGEWMAERGNRPSIVLATKVRGRMWDGPDGEGLSRAHIVRAVEDSLSRLGSDHIDLYQAHWFDAGTPIEETLRAMDDLVRAGKVRYVGASNYPAWRLMQALWASDAAGIARYNSLQPHYNLVHREEFERELEAVCLTYGIGVIPYSPLGGGFLTGKYRRGEPLPESARAGGIQKRYLSDPKNFDVIETLDGIAGSCGATIAQVSVAWLLHRPVITAPIIGANSVEQLAGVLPAAELSLDEGVLAMIAEALGDGDSAR